MRPASDFTAFVRARLPVGPVASVPELRLHQAGPHSGLRRWAEQAGVTTAPYWAHVWGGGLVLARFILDHPDAVRGRTVFDFGTGSGLVAIAAARAGARSVLASDSDPYAVAVATLNAECNGVEIQAMSENLESGIPPETEVVLAGDVFYGPKVAARSLAFLDRCAAAGARVLIGDPGRTDLPLDRLDLIFSRRTPDFGTRGDGASEARVFVLRPAEQPTQGRSARV